MGTLLQVTVTLLLYSYCAYDINRADWQDMKKKESPDGQR